MSIACRKVMFLGMENSSREPSGQRSCPLQTLLARIHCSDSRKLLADRYSCGFFLQSQHHVNSWMIRSLLSLCATSVSASISIFYHRLKGDENTNHVRCVASLSLSLVCATTLLRTSNATVTCIWWENYSSASFNRIKVLMRQSKDYTVFRGKELWSPRAFREIPRLTASDLVSTSRKFCKR